MCFKQFTVFLIVFFIINFFHQICTVPTNKGVTEELVIRVPFGETVTLVCRSNDENHMFSYWHLNEKNTVVGPSNNNYDNGKFNYEVLSGNLTVRAVSKQEEGVYNCVSKGVKKDDVNIRSVRMVVEKNWEEVYEHDPNVNLYRAVIVICSLTIVAGVGYAGYRIWRNRFRQPSYLVPSDDEDDSGDELFRTPPNVSQGRDNLAKSNSTDSFEAPGISTDFKSILDTVNNK